jgi:hypothetical protein
MMKVQEKLTEDHLSRLASQHMPATAYQATKQIGTAVELPKNVIALKQRRYKEAHLSRIVSEVALDNCYGQYTWVTSILLKQDASPVVTSVGFLG